MLINKFIIYLKQCLIEYLNIIILSIFNTQINNICKIYFNKIKNGEEIHQSLNTYYKTISITTYCNYL